MNVNERKDPVGVVAALIWDEEGKRFLICQRPANKKRGMLWEFAGGKIESGETEREALIRELREELGFTAAPGELFMEVVHAYPDLTVRLSLFHTRIASGTPTLLEHNDMRWITPAEIGSYEFCPADTDILAEITKRYG